MQSPALLPRGAVAGLALTASALLLLVGAVMAKEHVPIAIEPDAALPEGVRVATFALG
jgi:hypothetical protein